MQAQIQLKAQYCLLQWHKCVDWEISIYLYNTVCVQTRVGWMDANIQTNKQKQFESCHISEPYHNLY